MVTGQEHGYLGHSCVPGTGQTHSGRLVPLVITEGRNNLIQLWQQGCDEAGGFLGLLKAFLGQEIPGRSRLGERSGSEAPGPDWSETAPAPLFPPH